VFHAQTKCFLAKDAKVSLNMFIRHTCSKLTRTYLKIDLSEQFRHASEGWHPELSEMTGFLPPQE
jgi:hypothetical protein